MEDPRSKEPKPPFPKQHQDPPGLERKMTPRPDHGEWSYVGHGRLEGRRAFVSGGDSGIGRAVALAFAREGAQVAIGYLPEEESDAQDAVAAIEESGGTCLALPGDIRDPATCHHAIDRVVKEFGGIDVLVNNAGWQQTFASILEISPEELDRTFRTNIFAMFYLCQAAIPYMKPGASIINTASIQAFRPSPTLLHYAATKGAIVNFTQGLSQQLAEKGIRVNAVAPGPVWTPLIPSSMETETFGEQAPLKRPGQPAELAPVYVLLASDESSYVTGMVYGVTGGELFT
ncbi:MAG TPA: SDR family oxidoreductase [Usitatibacter sp.]|nr:SDR family oxidoreductase [Usitatibacter sp.]